MKAYDWTRPNGWAPASVDRVVQLGVGACLLALLLVVGAGLIHRPAASPHRYSPAACALG